MTSKPPWAVRLVSERMRQGWTQQQLVSRLRRAAGRELPSQESLLRMVREWESGRRQPGIEYRYLFVHVYGISEQELFGSPYSLSTTSSASVNRLGVGMWEEKACSREAVNRATQLAFGAVFSESMDSIINDARRIQLPARVNMADVRYLTDSVTLFHQWDHRYGGGMCRDAALAQLKWATDLMSTSSSHQVSRRLSSLMGNLANQIAWMTFDVGLHNPARRLFLVALHAALRAEDWELRAHVLAGMARQAIHVGHPEDGLRFIRLAQSGADEVGPLTRALLHLVKARAYGRQGSGQDCLRQIGKAEENFAQSTSDSPEWMDYVTEAQLHGDAGSALFYLVQLHGIRHDEAASRLELAVKSYDDPWIRSKALALVLLATVRFSQGDVEQGCVFSKQLLTVSAGVRSIRLAEAMHGLRLAAKRFARIPEVREIDREVSRLLPLLT